MNISSKERFNNFWVVIFSLMVGYLIYFFIGSSMTNSLFKYDEVATFVGIFFMTSCMVSIYIVLNFLLERRLSRNFLYILWIHYYVLFFIIHFCLNIGESGLIVKFMDNTKYLDLDYFFMIIRCTILFIPLGYNFRKEIFIKSLSFMVLFILTIELFQNVLHLGTFDLNEIFFSLVGFSLGYFISQKKKKRKRRKPVNTNEQVHT
ncbi:MAG: hypothetical protein ACRC41_17245 [Sarcina sp.]